MQTIGRCPPLSRASTVHSFRPDSQLGVFLDIDVAQGDLFHNGQEVQPVSLGVEKGLFQNKFFLRAGFLGDLSSK